MRTHDETMADGSADPTTDAGDEPTTGRRRGRRRLGTLALVAVAFLAGSLTSGAGAVWASHQFSDVPNGNQFHGDIDWLVDNGIANGYPDGTFKPTAPVSRQAFAAFLHRYNGEIQTVNGDAVNPAAGTNFYAQAICPVGTRVIGGSALSFSSGIVLVSASPTFGRTYQAHWTSRTGATVDPSSIAAQAICVPE